MNVCTKYSFVEIVELYVDHVRKHIVCYSAISDLFKKRNKIRYALLIPDVSLLALADPVESAPDRDARSVIKVPHSGRQNREHGIEYERILVHVLWFLAIHYAL